VSVIVREGQAVVLHYPDNRHPEGKVSGLDKIACLTDFKQGLDKLQLFRQRLLHKSVKAYATMPSGIMGRKSLPLID